MPNLNEQQLEERKIVIGHFFKAFRRERPWLVSREQATAHFLLYLDSDPVILRTINAMAATATPSTQTEEVL